MYIKTHSMGEFIFDQQFAEAAYANGIEYYPKMLVGVPFTPVTGERILLHSSVRDKHSRDELRQIRRAVGQFLRTIAQRNKLSSVHCNFVTDEEATDLAGPLSESNEKQRSLKGLLERLTSDNTRDDYLRRTSLQNHWVNANPKNNEQPFTDFIEYLSCFKSKRRINIKRERRKVADAGIRVDAIRGRDILQYDGLVERMFEIYMSTIDKMIWGRQYLTLDFFERLVQSDFVDHLVFLCARRREGNETSHATYRFNAEDVFAGTISTYLR